MSETHSGDGGCGCCLFICLLPLIVAILTACWFGLPTPWGKINIDVFPPVIWDMNAPTESTSK